MESILIIIGVNLFIFASIYFRPDLVGYLALTPVEAWSNPWQLITSVFTHQRIFHLFANMLAVYFLGTAVVQLLGPRRFWFIYLLGGIVGGLFFVGIAWITDARFVSAIGASGAVFALGGVLAVLRPKMRVLVFPIPVPMPLWIAIIGGFLVLSFFEGIAWEAHLGGLVFGGVAGFFFRQRKF